MSKRGISMMSMMRSTDLSQLAGNAKAKVKDLSGNSAQGGSRRSGGTPSSVTGAASYTSGNQHGMQTSSHSKAADLSMLKDFIRKNPDVKNEVEQILKETHTVIPGL
nr:hypothetical protein [Paenibacillus lemnae]